MESPNIERLLSDRARSAGVELVALFSPEHGIRGTEDRENLANGIDAGSGRPVARLDRMRCIQRRFGMDSRWVNLRATSMPCSELVPMTASTRVVPSKSARWRRFGSIDNLHTDDFAAHVSCNSRDQPRDPSP